MELINPKKAYQEGDHTIHSCQYHVVFTTKYRRPVLVGEIRNWLKELILEKCQELQAQILDVIIQPDFVHLLLEVPPKPGILKTVSQIKNYTAGVLRQAFPEISSRIPSLWTYQKFIASVGTVDLADIHHYLATQQGV
jgi:putative transposase